MRQFKTGYAGDSDNISTIAALSPIEAAKDYFLANPRNGTIFVSYGFSSEKAYTIDELKDAFPNLEPLTKGFARPIEEEEAEPTQMSALDQMKHFFLFTSYGKRLGSTILFLIVYAIYHSYKN